MKKLVKIRPEYNENEVVYQEGQNTGTRPRDNQNK